MIRPGTNWKQIQLPDACVVELGTLPRSIIPNDGDFRAIWNLHPQDRPIIKMHGSNVAIPRYQQAYLHNYYFSGQVSKAEPLPTLIEPIFQWLNGIDTRLNGLLLNWYEPHHYIGPHTDSTKDLIPDSDIYTVTLGEGRLMRFTHANKQHPRVDVTLESASVVRYSLTDTNRNWKHSVPKRKWKGRRISITARAFS